MDWAKVNVTEGKELRLIWISSSKTLRGKTLKTNRKHFVSFVTLIKL